MLPRCKATHLGSVWVTWVQVRLDQGFLGPWGKESILQSDNKVSNCTRVHVMCVCLSCCSRSCAGCTLAGCTLAGMLMHAAKVQSNPPGLGVGDLGAGEAGQGFLGSWGKESILQSDNKESNCTRVHVMCVCQSCCSSRLCWLHTCWQHICWWCDHACCHGAKQPTWARCG